MSRIVYQYRVKCLETHGYVTTEFMEDMPTKCPINNIDLIDENDITIVDKISENSDIIEDLSLPD